MSALILWVIVAIGLSYTFKLRGATRPSATRVAAGVCAAVANAYGWDVNYVRIGWVVLTILLGGLPLLVYIASAVMLPQS